MQIFFSHYRSRFTFNKYNNPQNTEFQPNAVSCSTCLLLRADIPGYPSMRLLPSRKLAPCGLPYPKPLYFLAGLLHAEPIEQSTLPIMVRAWMVDAFPLDPL